MTKGYSAVQKSKRCRQVSNGFCNTYLRIEKISEKFKNIKWTAISTFPVEQIRAGKAKNKNKKAKKRPLRYQTDERDTS